MKNLLFSRAALISLLLLGAVWIGFLLQQIGIIQNCSGAIMPRYIDGLWGVLFSPFLHANLEHIASNSLPLLMLLFLLFHFYSKQASRALIFGWLLSGFLVWLFPLYFLHGSQGIHCIIGASGIVYFLAFFIFFGGVFRSDKKRMAISALIALFYGGMLWGILPAELLSNDPTAKQISWQSHLWGAVVGIVLAFVYRKKEKLEKKYIWQYPNYYNEKDDLLWLQYKKENPEHFEQMPRLEETDPMQMYLESTKKIDLKQKNDSF